MNRESRTSGKTTELVPITKRIDGSVMGLPVIKVTGVSNGPTLLLVGGVHGDEPEGMMPILDVIDQLDPAHLNGTVIGVPIVHLSACMARRRGNPLEDWYYDVNRVFPGSAKGSPTQRVAHKMISEIAPQADLLIAMHSGGNNFYHCKLSILTNPEDTEEDIRLAKALGPGWNLIGKAAGEQRGRQTLAAMARQNGITSISIEIGGASDRLPDRFNEKVRDVVSMVQNVMKEYNMIEGNASYADELIILDKENLRANHGGLIKFGESCRLLEELREGEELLTIVDFFGKPVEVVRAPYDGMLISIPAQIVVPTGGYKIGTFARIVRRIPL